LLNRKWGQRVFALDGPHALQPNKRRKTGEERQTTYKTSIFSVVENAQQLAKEMIDQPLVSGKSKTKPRITKKDLGIPAALALVLHGRDSASRITPIKRLGGGDRQRRSLAHTGETRG
jgi:hypothetical protein